MRLVRILISSSSVTKTITARDTVGVGKTTFRIPLDVGVAI